jgi:tetratricopeptide (TPR) repeat protein
MITGERPFQANSMLQMLMMHVNEPVPSIQVKRPDLPVELDEVVQRAMAKDRDSRFRSTAEMSMAIRVALGGNITTNPTHLREAAGTSVIRRLGKHTATDVQPTPSAQHKTVVTLNVSAAAYGELIAEDMNDEAAQRALTTFWTAAIQRLSEHGAVIFTRTDHELLALWGSTSAREDDSEQAIRAGLHLQATLREVSVVPLDADESLPLNIGIHRGLALLTPGDKTNASSVSGVTISLTNRLMQTAEGLLLITHEVFRQVLGVFDMQPGEPLKMRGRAEKVTTYQVERAKPRAFRVTLHGVEGIETRLIGRDAEFKHLQKVFFIAVEDGETQVVTLVGDAGVGKSRLLYEFDKWSDLRPEQYFIFSGRATPAMTQRPYALIRDVLSFRFEVMDDDTPAVALSKFEAGVAGLVGKHDETAHLIAYLCGVDVSGSAHIKNILSDAQETNRRARHAVIQFINTLTKLGQGPVVIELEDIHYADDASLDLLNDLFIADDDRHLLVLCSARTALYERRPTWGSGQRFHTRLDLKPLDKRDSRDLLLNILQKVPDVPKDLRDKLVERAEGNPLYLEELVKMLLDDHVILKESEEVWRVETSRLDNLHVPSTLAGLMEARFDTLLYPEKMTLQRASVIGRIFYDSALQAIDRTDDIHLNDLPTILTKLTERELIYRRETSAFADSTEYLFASAMLRDLLYDRLLERQRQIYHTGAADWLVGLERADDYLPLIAEHYEKAGKTDQAAAFLQRAGAAASRRGAYRESVNFFGRALALLPGAAAELKLPLLLGLGDAYNWLGDIELARTHLSEALALARSLHSTEDTATVLHQLSLTETSYGHYAQAQAYLDEALPLAQTGGNQKLLASVLYGLANVNFRTGKYAASEAFAVDCIALCQATGDDVQRIYALNRGATAIGSDVGRIPEAETYLQDALELARRIGHGYGQQIVLGNLGWAAAGREDWDAMLRYTETSLVLARELGNVTSMATNANNLAQVYLDGEKFEAAAASLLEALTAAKKSTAQALIVSMIDTTGRWKVMRGDPDGGLKLLGLASNHPAAEADVLDDLHLWLKKHRDNIPFSDAEIEVMMAAGKDLDLETVVDDLLQELKAYTAHPPRLE